MDSTLGKTLLVGISLILCSGVWADNPLCERSDACRCFLSNGSVINLESLASSDKSPRFREQYKNESGWVTYNPCKSFNGEEECQDAAACLQEKAGPSGLIYISIIAKQDSVAWTIKEGVNTILYKYKHRIFEVSLVCDETLNDTLKITDLSGNTTKAELTSKCACAGKCYTSDDPSTPTKHSISTGSILLILFFTLVFLYLVGGIIYNKIVNGATGKELIPNVEFWTALPKLVLDGIAFTCNCCGKRRSTPGYDNV